MERAKRAQDFEGWLALARVADASEVVASRQHGLVSRQQASEAGLSNPDCVACFTRLADSGAPQGLPGDGSPRDLAATADGGLSVGAGQGGHLTSVRSGAVGL